ncbi:DNA repair protein RecN [Sporolactobacillus sp. Y61]|jgi:DNA repair protein RecN (Recombination protein N)|uniref:DNA repair protein RecN n=1 Tax=Sporolactobacillus sp. Y61 TaxID=3160863 RepID=A0AAU8IDS4_9BACL
MLLELQVENFAIIDKLRINFDEGMTVITGETGAGKSIIIDAIGLLSGARASSDFVRQGATKAELEALFEVDPKNEALQELKGMGIDCSDHMIILRREIYAKGKSICRINGKLVTLNIMQKVGSRLVDIHGQHEHQLLMDPTYHLPLIDRFGGDKLAHLKKEYEAAYNQAADIARRLTKFNKDEKMIAQRMDLLKYQIQEIEKASITPGEDESLLEEKRKLANFEKVFQTLKSVYESLDGENRGLDWIRRAASELESVQDLDKDIGSISEDVTNSLYMLEERATAVRDYLEQMEYQPGRLDEIEQRLSELDLLKRKYGSTLEEILNYYKNIKEEYDALTHRDENCEELQHALRAQMDTLRERALSLSTMRQKTTSGLNQAVNSQLKDLCMPHAVFKSIIRRQDRLDHFESYRQTGIDDAEFLISTNPGEPMKPLAKTASGGELSRIMLALKVNFKQIMNVSTVIFDEVDTGVSGRAAQAMAEKIFSLSKASQVFCITHLPQVASMADHHLYISKRVTAEHRTKTSVKKLNDADKIREIGRMISGTEITDLTKKHAREMLEMAGKVKK